jgi:hypothetical protein
VALSIDSLIASCFAREVQTGNRLVVEIIDSNIPPMVTILRSEGIIVESVSPLIFTSSEVECISVHGIFPYLDVLASCWFGSIRTFLQIKSSSLASCEVPDGIVGNISVTVTEDSTTQFLSRHFFILILK